MTQQQQYLAIEAVEAVVEAVPEAAKQLGRQIDKESTRDVTIPPTEPRGAREERRGEESLKTEASN